MDEIDLSRRMGSLSESATLALNARAQQLAADGKTIYNLTAGELASDTPEYIQEAVAKVLNKNKYTPVAGLPELREAIAANARSFYGLDWIQAKNVVVTAGAKPALYATFLATLNPGDEVIVPTPTWNTYNHVIELVGAQVIEVPMTETFDLDVAAIVANISSRTKAILLNSPHNPTGTVFSKAALDKLAGAIMGKGLLVVADDIYAKLVYADDFSLVPTHNFEQMVIVNGFSKSQALTGWRIGYVIANQNVAAAITSLLSHITSNAPLPSQYAALAALARGDVPPQSTMDTLKKQRAMVADALSNIPGLVYREPGGAFYAFLDVRGLTDSSAQWCEDLLNESGVALVPGEAFSAPGFARLSFVAKEETLKSALTLIRQFATKGNKA